MQHITPRLAGPVVWRQHGIFSSDYFLYAGDVSIAKVTFRGLCKSVTTAESADGCWTFRREGFVRARTLIRRCGADSVEGTLHHKGVCGCGGRLELKTGSVFWVKTHTWSSQVDVCAEESGSPIVMLRPEGFFRQRARVEFTASASDNRELPLLTLLGFHLVVAMSRDTAAAG